MARRTTGLFDLALFALMQRCGQLVGHGEVDHGFSGAQELDQQHHPAGLVVVPGVMFDHVVERHEFAGCPAVSLMPDTDTAVRRHDQREVADI